MSFRTASSGEEPILSAYKTNFAQPGETFSVTHVTAQIKCKRYKRHCMSRERQYYVYMLASKSRVLYGVTGSLMSRVLRHKAEEGGVFTRKYRVNRLVWYQSLGSVGNAIARETEIKAWRREEKVALIRESNPTWEDIAADCGQPLHLKYRGPAREKQLPHG